MKDGWHVVLWWYRLTKNGSNFLPIHVPTHFSEWLCNSAPSRFCLGLRTVFGQENVVPSLNYAKKPGLVCWRRRPRGTDHLQSYPDEAYYVQTPEIEPTTNWFDWLRSTNLHCWSTDIWKRLNYCCSKPPVLIQMVLLLHIYPRERKAYIH